MCVIFLRHCANQMDVHPLTYMQEMGVFLSSLLAQKFKVIDLSEDEFDLYLYHVVSIS